MLGTRALDGHQCNETTSTLRRSACTRRRRQRVHECTRTEYDSATPRHMYTYVVHLAGSCTWITTAFITINVILQQRPLNSGTSTYRPEPPSQTSDLDFYFTAHLEPAGIYLCLLKRSIRQQPSANQTIIESVSL